MGGIGWWSGRRSSKRGTAPILRGRCVCRLAPVCRRHHKKVSTRCTVGRTVARRHRAVVVTRRLDVAVCGKRDSRRGPAFVTAGRMGVRHFSVHSSLCAVSESFVGRFVCRKVGRVGLRQREGALSPFRTPSNESQTNGSRNLSRPEGAPVSTLANTGPHKRASSFGRPTPQKSHADGAHTFLKRLRRPRRLGRLSAPTFAPTKKATRSGARSSRDGECKGEQRGDADSFEQSCGRDQVPTARSDICGRCGCDSDPHSSPSCNATSSARAS